jgi:hypothetical protein
MYKIVIFNALFDLLRDHKSVSVAFITSMDQENVRDFMDLTKRQNGLGLNDVPLKNQVPKGKKTHLQKAQFCNFYFTSLSCLYVTNVLIMMIYLN